MECTYIITACNPSAAVHNISVPFCPVHLKRDPIGSPQSRYSLVVGLFSAQEWHCNASVCCTGMSVSAIRVMFFFKHCVRVLPVLSYTPSLLCVQLETVVLFLCTLHFTCICHPPAFTSGIHCNRMLHPSLAVPAYCSINQKLPEEKAGLKPADWMSCFDYKYYLINQFCHWFHLLQLIHIISIHIHYLDNF